MDAGPIIKWLLIAAAAAALVAGCWWAYESWRSSVLAEGDAIGAGRVQKTFDAYRITQETQARESAQEMQRLSGRIAANAAQGERDAIQKADQRTAIARRDADAYAAAHRGLLGDIASLNAAAASAGVPDAASCPAELVRERAASVLARNLLGACDQALGDMARAADESFSSLTLKLDTALGYIKAVAPP